MDALQLIRTYLRSKGEGVSQERRRYSDSEVGEQVRDGAVECGVEQVWGDFGEGGEDEAALVHGGVGQGEVGVGEDLGVSSFSDVEEEIEVDDAGALRWDGGAVATHGVLDGEKATEDVERASIGFEERGGVEEARLVEIADGVGCVKAGDGGDLAEIGEAVEGFAEVVGGRAEAGREVGAESDGGGHGVGFA
jgi:hypothetical protein